MNHGSLFSGIGGFDLAAEWMGWNNVFHCEWNPFGRKVLNHYWPNSISYEDITKTDFSIHRGNIDILTGGFPCQPYSMAGKRLGKDDERHLWPEMLRAIREISPRWVVGENVFGLVNWNGGMVFDEVQADLEAQGYEVQPFVLPACAVNAPHRRDRVWFVAFKDTNKDGWRGEFRKEESNVREQRDACSRDNERIPTDNGETWFVAYRNGTGLQKEGAEQQAAGIEQYRELDETTPDANSNGQQRIYGQHEKHTSEGREYALGNIKPGNGYGDVTDTKSKGSRRELQQRQGEGQFGRQNSRNEHIPSWANFPTQSPICSGDDGLPTQLDGITFPKWRNESIKAYGNAIVPQVVYQIFKAISIFEQNAQP
jgi:DNA (cytosine-5)-methyltransferase 1